MGIKFAMITQRLFCDNFPSNGSSKSSGWLGAELTWWHIVPDHGVGILSDFTRFP
ncbi:MAG: hypothetical protein F6K16_26325 [Symploca sp. SIO2B6]|nr:hypothetical protein [Symploca sp. SIO2B6]